MIEPRLLAILECPRDHSALRVEGGTLCCDHGHRYPVVDGIPVFLLAEKAATIDIAAASLAAAENGTGGPLYLETLGLSNDERRGIEKDWDKSSKIDAAISYLIGATSGLAYVNLIGRLQDYPIPEIPIDRGNGGLLLDIGSNWGRWSLAAAHKGWSVIGIDPSLGALMAARRAFSASEPKLAFVCGDARHLPFKRETFSGAFSYSVLQHFSEADAEAAIAEVGRVLARGGFAKIQMAHAGGLRSRYMRWRDRNAGDFRVRYWPLSAMRAVFEKQIGPCKLIAEAFGGLGLLPEDRKYMHGKNRLLITLSTWLKTLARIARPLIRLADSVYVVATKR